jgi:hypothetical protein
MDEQGRVQRWPTGKGKRAVQAAIMDYLASKFESDRIYHEREVNDLLNQWHMFEDWAMLRRELFSRGYLGRKLDGTQYWLKSLTPEPQA